MDAVSRRSVLGTASRRTPRRAFAACALATFALLAGCLDFDEQEIRVAYDAKNDRIDAQLVYRGLYSAGSSGWRCFEIPAEKDDVEGTQRQLDQLQTGKPIFALLNSVWQFDLAELRESDDPQVAALASLVTVDVGAPFRDVDGRLCGWQHLRVRDVHRAFELCDGLFRAKLADGKEAELYRREFGCGSRVSAALWAAALEKRSRWFEAVEGTLLWHVPASEGDALALMKRIERAPSLEQYLARANAEKWSDAGESAKGREVQRSAEATGDNHDTLVVLLHALGVSARRTASGVDLVLWDPKRAPQEGRCAWRPANSARWDLAPYLEKRRMDVRTDVTDESLRRDFDERRAR